MEEDNNNNKQTDDNSSSNYSKNSNKEEKLEDSKLNEALTLTLPIEDVVEEEEIEVKSTNEQTISTITNMKPVTDEQQLTNQELTESKQDIDENDLANSSTTNNQDYSTIMKMLSDLKKSKLNEEDLINEETSDFIKLDNLNEVQLEEVDDIESVSNHTSYQELPSVCKSTTMVDEPADETSKLNNSEKEDTLDQSLLRKPSFLDQLSKKNLLNTSTQSMTSQCTIDSLAKRVQSLVGPIDYKKTSSFDSKFDLSITSSKKDELNNLNKHSASSINYDSIYKELDSIQDTLRMQHSFNKHLEKLTASRAEIKDLLSNDKLSESTFSTVTKVSPLSYTATTNSVSSIDSVKLNKDYSNTSTKLTNYDTFSIKPKLYSSTDLRTFKEDETKYFSKKINDLKSDLEALSLINNSINKDLNTTNKFTIDLKSKLSSNYLTTSLTRMSNLSDVMPNKMMSSMRATSRSAFESDPDLLLKNKYQFMNFSKLGKSYSNTDTETIESSHSESDDAKSPIFSSDVYGSRPTANSQSTKLSETTKPHLVGIYDRKKVLDHSKSDDKLDPEYLREMDKKLKKLIKKNLSKDLILSNTNKNQNAVTWEIEANSKTNVINNKIDDSVLSHGSTTASCGNLSPPPHPYLPLRDVPMHDIVKKLQRQFELEQNVTQSTEMNKLWEEIKCKVESKSNENGLDLTKLNSLIKNPVKTLLNTELGQQESENEDQKTNKSTNHVSPSKSKTPNSNIKPLLLNESTSSIKLENIKNLNKEKIKEMIEYQKQRHERRVKALEKLAKLERLQAEKLKKILQINDNMITPQMYEMFIQQNSNSYLDVNETIGNETIVDLDEALKDENLSILINEDKKQSLSKPSSPSASNKKYSNLQDKKKETNENNKLNEKTKSKVEILNLKNTSMFEPPEGIIVVKESEHKMKPDSRVFFTIPCRDSTPTDSKKVNSKSETFINTQRISTVNKSTILKSKSKSHSYNNINYENIELNEEPKKLSLQEAFELYKYDLISRSRQRQKEIQFRAEQRQRELEYEVEQIEHFKKIKEQQLKKKLIDLNTFKKGKNKKGLMFEINVENFVHKRSMTSQDIKKQTKKIYEKLPEVQQKQLQLRAEELKRQNRLKSTLYRKTLQQRVLSRGPNFNLREAFVS